MDTHASDLATMVPESSTINPIDPMEKTRIGTTEQPLSRLHAFPPELREMIFTYVVVSPEYIPSRITTRDIKVPKAVTTEDQQSTETTTTNTTTTTTNNKTPPPPKILTTQYQILPTQPLLSHTDRSTRTEVLRLFYSKNTFLFRVTNLVPNPLQTWLTMTGPCGSGGIRRLPGGRSDYADGAAKLIARVALERSERKTCGPPRTPESSQEVQTHTYRVVVELDKKEQQKRQQPEHQEHHRLHLQPQHQKQTPLLTIHCESDLSPMCACYLQASASLKPPGRYITSIKTRHTEVAEALAFACDLEETDFGASTEGCGWGLCEPDKYARVCVECDKLVLKEKWLAAGGGPGAALRGYYEVLRRSWG